ncbi:hypothetical protein [Nitrosovibrio sp. Nv6]|uniref:hypothetical protein n=1 Tax=Nitrosovibrio sp. Nv6 TaxID=1855340 RepID=UPI0008AF155E|nr:hypothetical protein [Nitrosovibrio sp. Nv6]SEO63774.1 hypothetical protein SAMN05216316_0678 [Nitrosovibrio sp. Nv6]
MNDIDKHIRLGNGLTAEFMEGTVILFRVHKDPKKIPGDIEETFIACEAPTGEFYLVENCGEQARFLAHEAEPGELEFKAYTGEMGTLRQRRRVRRFLEQIHFNSGIIERFKNDKAPHVKQVRTKDDGI